MAETVPGHQRLVGPVGRGHDVPPRHGRRRRQQDPGADPGLDQRIAGAPPGRVGPDLLDQRDLLLDELAQLTGAVARDQADGSVGLTVGGQPLLTADGPARFEATTAGDGTSAIRIVDAAGTDAGRGRVRSPSAASSAASSACSATDLPHWRDDLDALAVELADAINAVNARGRLADGSPPVARCSPSTPLTPPARSRLTTDDVAALAAAAGPAGSAAPGPHDGTQRPRLRRPAHDPGLERRRRPRAATIARPPRRPHRRPRRRRPLLPRGCGRRRRGRDGRAARAGRRARRQPRRGDGRARPLPACPRGRQPAS